MGKPVTNPVKEQLRVKIGALNYKALISLGDSVVLHLSGNLIFPSPAPPLIDLSTAIANLRATNTLIGTKRNKGSKSDVIACRTSATTLRAVLIQLAGYVLSTLSPNASVPDYNAALATAGFALKSKRSRVAKMQSVTFIQQNNNAKFIPSDGRIKFRKPRGLLKGLVVDGFNVYKGGVLVGTTTATFFLTGQAVNTVGSYIVRPFNARGEGHATNITVRT